MTGRVAFRLSVVGSSLLGLCLAFAYWPKELQTERYPCELNIPYRKSYAVCKLLKLLIEYRVNLSFFTTMMNEDAPEASFFEGVSPLPLSETCCIRFGHFPAARTLSSYF